ncbi:hypothetical protein ACFU9F_36585, partial [Streptomyces zhihengii]|uniref:hypothetical protein n=1 Tax=Streptomyces zhihengii TaxID=1818004 RepID=UPI0036C4137C
HLMHRQLRGALAEVPTAQGDAPCNSSLAAVEEVLVVVDVRERGDGAAGEVGVDLLGVVQPVAAFVDRRREPCGLVGGR